MMVEWILLGLAWTLAGLAWSLPFVLWFVYYYDKKTRQLMEKSWANAKLKEKNSV